MCALPMIMIMAAVIIVYPIPMDSIINIVNAMK